MASDALDAGSRALSRRSTRDLRRFRTSTGRRLGHVAECAGAVACERTEGIDLHGEGRTCTACASFLFDRGARQDGAASQPAMLNAIRWRSSATHGSRRDLLRQKNVLVSGGNHMTIQTSPNQQNSKHVDPINACTSRHTNVGKTAKDGKFDMYLKISGKRCSFDSYADMCNCIDSWEIAKSHECVWKSLHLRNNAFQEQPFGSYCEFINSSGQFSGRLSYFTCFNVKCNGFRA